MLGPAATAEAAPPPGRWAGPLGAGLALTGLFVLAAAFSIWIGRSPGWAYDFYAYYDAALRLVATGTPYQAETLAGPFRPGPYGLYLYAPPLAILFVPLTWLGEQAGVLAWLALRVGVLVLICALMPISRPLRMATFGIATLSAPVLFDLNLGNVSLIVTLFGVLIWRWLDRPAAGVVLALALALRPTTGIIAVWWLLRARWQPVVATVIAGLVLVAATLPFVGIARWLEYLTVLRNVSDVTGVHRNVDLGSAVLMLGGSPQVAQGAILLGYAYALGAILLSLRCDREKSYVVTLCASLVLAPLLWDHYLTHLLVPAAFVASRGPWWALLLPLVAWIPVALLPGILGSQGAAHGFLSLVALGGVVLPFLAPDKGEPAAAETRRLLGRWLRRPAPA